jgi:hemerythrin-like domain-containing protein
MNRVIHGAFRRDLERFEDALGRFRDGDTHRAEQLWTAWANFDEQLTRHHTSEHEIGFPALRQMGISDETIARWDAEHDRLAAALASAREAMKRLRSSASADSAKAAGEAIAELSATAAVHLDHEEADSEQFMLARKGTPEMKAMARKFSRDMKLSEAGTFFVWLEDGASTDEKAALRQNVPAPVMTIIGGVLGRTYRRSIAPVWQA